jgi:UDP-GlcNAc:undecaprenyl-phosphate GlcNAc-1-phosphate transferase
MATAVLFASFPIPHSTFPILAFALPLLIATLLTAGLIRWAPRLGLIDHPGARKVHTRPVPRGGGLAIYAALALTECLLSLVEPDPASLYRRLLLGSVIVVLGLVDDLRPLPWQLRLGVQAVVAVVAVLVCLPLAGAAERALAVVWVVGMTNSFNMLDNMDGLSGGVAWIAAGFFALTVALRRQAGAEVPAAQALSLLMLMGALSGFLWYNAPPARIFMGDAGSTFLGFFLGLAGADAALAPGGPRWAAAVPLCVCAVACYDTATVVFLRLRQGRSPFHGDKQHLSHRLVERGLPPPTAVRLIYLLALASGAAGLLLYAVGTWAGAALAAGQLAVWWVALAVLEYFTRLRLPAPDVTESLPSEKVDKTV